MKKKLKLLFVSCAVAISVLPTAVVVANSSRVPNPGGAPIFIGGGGTGGGGGLGGGGYICGRHMCNVGNSIETPSADQ